MINDVLTNLLLGTLQEHSQHLLSVCPTECNKGMKVIILVILVGVLVEHSSFFQPSSFEHENKLTNIVINSVQIIQIRTNAHHISIMHIKNRRIELSRKLYLTFLAWAFMVRVTAVFNPSRWDPPSDVRIPMGIKWRTWNKMTSIF